MQLPQDGTLIRIFIGEADKYEGKLLELIEPRIKAGLVTLEKAKIKFYRCEP